MSTKPFKHTWPRVIRSPEVDDGTLFAIDGVNFEDGLRRIIVDTNIAQDGVILIEEVLRQIDYADQQRSWFEAVLNGETNEKEKP